MDDPSGFTTSLLIPVLQAADISSYLFIQILAIGIALMLSAFFSGMEIAFISANKLRIELNSKQGSRAARILSKHLQNPSLFISTTLVGNNIALVIYGIFMGQILESAFNPVIGEDFIRFAVVTIVSTLVVLITAEFLPKLLFRINPDAILLVLIFPFQFFYFLFAGVVWFIHKLSRLILKWFAAEEVDESPVFTKVDLDNIVNEYEITESDEEMELDTEVFRNALDFSNIKLRECMIPRTELSALKEDSPIEEAVNMFIETGFSKLLVYTDSIDNIIGYIHRTDLFSKPQNVKSIVRSIIITNESKPANELLSEFMLQQKSIAVVVDEYGGTSGIVTIEDIIEEIFGEIEDEHDTEDLKEVVVNSKQYIFSARLEVDYINDTYNLDIPTGEYETIGGYIIHLQESIPQEGDVIENAHMQFIILKVENSRIIEVEVRIY
jgi:putative hemolysin